MREGFFAPRRRATRQLIADAEARRELRADLDPELMIDMLFGPIVFQLLNGLEPLGERENAAMAGITLSALRA